MIPLVGRLLLAARDQGLEKPEIARPLALLVAASPGTTAENLAHLPLTVRDRELWRLRAITFGDELRALLPCAGCAETIEFGLSASAVIESLSDQRLFSPVEQKIDGWDMRIRPIASADLAMAMERQDDRAAKAVLFERCVSMNDPDGRAVSWNEAPESLRQDAVACFERLHEDVGASCALTCPACGSQQQTDLDIGRLLWAEIAYAAARLLREIHELASAYGWTERTILGLSALRRQAYLNMVRA